MSVLDDDASIHKQYDWCNVIADLEVYVKEGILKDPDSCDIFQELEDALFHENKEFGCYDSFEIRRKWIELRSDIICKIVAREHNEDENFIANLSRTPIRQLIER